MLKLDKQVLTTFMNKLTLIARLLLVTILLLTQVNFMFSDYTSLFNEDMIEITEQEENELEEEIKKKQYVDHFFGTQYVDQTTLFFNGQLSYTLREQYVDIFLPPPDLNEKI